MYGAWDIVRIPAVHNEVLGRPQLALTCWVLICYVVLLAVSLVGDITLIKTAFLSFFFITLAIDQIFGVCFSL
jgi:heme O synthase-like polyprenyltransferase